jgi:hypothetical protein
MPGSVTSVFGQSDDFRAAPSADGILSFVVTGLGHFRARLMRVTLHDLRLSAGDEHLSRIDCGARVRHSNGSVITTWSFRDRWPRRSPLLGSGAKPICHSTPIDIDGL